MFLPVINNNVKYNV